MSRSWFSDFKWQGGGLLVRKTGIVVPVNFGVVSATLRWFDYFFAIKKAIRQAAPLTSGRAGRQMSIGFWPDQPRPWYLIWPIAHLAGLSFASHPRDADVLMHFSDEIAGPGELPAFAKPEQKLINFACPDISKSRIARLFEESFGYPLMVDPRTFVGTAVVKSEGNGRHDGRLIELPAEPLPGHTYQVLVDNQTTDGLVADLRTPTINGEVVCVFIKQRPIAARFSNDNVSVTLKQPKDLFSQEELAKIAHFCRAVGLDWGGLDVLRDRNTGRLYIVDANKTDMGPPTSLPLADKMAASEALAKAFRSFIAAGG